MVVSILGGLLGILMMIPLRRAFIVKLHGRPGEAGKLLYPEGTACAQVLISGEKGGTSGKTVFIGFGIAFVHKFLTEGHELLRTTLDWPMKFFSKAADCLPAIVASELLGVGLHHRLSHQRHHDGRSRSRHPGAGADHVTLYDRQRPA